MIADISPIYTSVFSEVRAPNLLILVNLRR